MIIPPTAWMFTQFQTKNITFIDNQQSAEDFKKRNPDWIETPLYAQSILDERKRCELIAETPGMAQKDIARAIREGLMYGGTNT